VKDGGASIRTTYADGGQHAIFMAMTKAGANLGDVSRPEALAYAGRDVILTPARPTHRSDIVQAAVAELAPEATPLKAHSLMSGAAPILDDAFAPHSWTLLARQGV
jgi:hypothetical protein